MPDRTLSQPELFQSLQRQQRKHEALVAKVEKTSARLARRTSKLQAIEAHIAELERRLAEPRKQHLGDYSASDEPLTRVQLIFNPSSGPDAHGQAERLAEIVKCLRAHGIEAEVEIKTSGHVAREVARNAARSGDRLILVAGGDGTIGEVASQLIGSKTALGIIPTGTMNNVARSLGVPLAIDDACALIGMGTTRHIDIGHVVSNGDHHSDYFLECAGIGLSAIGAEGGEAIVKGKWHVVPRALRRFLEAKRGAVTVELDGTRIEASTRIVTVSNAPLIGNHMLAAPGAKMDDGLLDVHVYDRISDAALVRHFIAASSGSPDDLECYRVRHVRITADEPMPTNTDMNIAPKRHTIEIEVIPRAVAMIVGNGIALSVPVTSAPPAPTFAAGRAAAAVTLAPGSAVGDAHA